MNIPSPAQAVHLVWLYRRRRDQDRESFERYWQGAHAEQVRRLAPVRRYARNRVLAPAAVPAPPWDGVAELWVDDAQAADDLIAGRGWAEALRADERRFVDIASVARLRTVDRVVVAGPPSESFETRPKRMSFFRHRPDLDRTQSLRYWREQHAPLAASPPGLFRYVQSTVVDRAGVAELAPFDGVAQLFFDDDAALGSIVASALFREVIKPDEGNFIDVASAMVLPVQECRIG